MKYSLSKKSGRRGMRRLFWPVLAVVILLLVASGVGFGRYIYHRDLEPVSTNPATQIITIQSGSSLKQIAAQLRAAHLVRSAWAFTWYVHSKHLSDKLQAGTYAFSQSQGVEVITQTLTGGKATNHLVTILPGKRLYQVRAALINDGFSPSSVDAALDPAKYSDLPVFSYKPADVITLEGMLFPDSFQRDATTTPDIIVRESLQEMGQKLSPDIIAAFQNEGLSPYQGVVLASIVEQEVSKPDDRTQVAQVFLKRLHTGMTLGSDVTAHYAHTMAQLNPGKSFDAYDTTKNQGLPPTPIATVSEISLSAAAHPANTDWLYFVTGDDGTTHFSKTFSEHQALTAQYCHKLCAKAQ